MAAAADLTLMTSERLRSAEALCGHQGAAMSRDAARSGSGLFESSVFLAEDEVITRQGQTLVSGLEPGTELLTRGGFRRLNQIDRWYDEEALVELPATVATQGNRYFGDPRRYLFVCGAEVELATGAADGLLFLKDLLGLPESVAAQGGGRACYRLHLEDPAVLVCQAGSFANEIGNAGSRVLAPREAIFVFGLLLRRGSNGRRCHG